MLVDVAGCVVLALGCASARRCRLVRRLMFSLVLAAASVARGLVLLFRSPKAALLAVLSVPDALVFALVYRRADPLTAYVVLAFTGFVWFAAVVSERVQVFDQIRRGAASNRNAASGRVSPPPQTVSYEIPPGDTQWH